MNILRDVINIIDNMVKGNWERRVELVATRRIENQRKKQEKQSKVSIATGESVLTKLMNDEILLNDTSITIMIWLETKDSLDVCSNWWRTESCEHKKCKYLHTTSTISHLNNLIAPVTTMIEGSSLPLITEKLCECKGVYDVLRKDSHKIRIISLNSTCIYDYYVPTIWTEFINERKIYLNSLTKLPNATNLVTIEEKVIHEDNDSDADNDVDGLIDSICDNMNFKTTTVGQNITTGENYFNRLLLHQEIKAIQFSFEVICSYLTDSEMILFSNMNKNIQKYCQKIELLRNRKKEIFSYYIKEQMKKKKLEEKKKIKQANVKKNSKKDGFARGGNSK